MARISLFLIGLLAIGAAVSPAQAKNCKNSPNYVAPDDIKYKDGVDAQSWAVAPADLNPPAFGADDLKGVGVDLNLPARQYLDESKHNLNLERVDIGVGHVHAGMDGSVDLGGKSLTTPDGDSDCQ